jgi:hypothetical protein
MLKLKCDMCPNEFSVYPYKLKEGKGKHCSRKCYELYKRTIPAWNKGKPATWAIGNKHRVGLKNPFLSELNKSRVLEKNAKWKGDDVGYTGLHVWIRNNLGQPQKCEHCNLDGLTGHKIHWANKSYRYLRDKDDWIRLCAKCHGVYDSDRRRKHK